MYKVTIFLAFFVTTFSFAQSVNETRGDLKKDGLIYFWKVNPEEDGWVPQNLVRLKKCVLPEMESRKYDIFGYNFFQNKTFQLKEYRSGKLVQSNRSPDECRWKWKNDTLNIYMRGAGAESSYEYDIDYIINKLDNDSLILKSVKENINRRKEERK